MRNQKFSLSSTAREKVKCLVDRKTPLLAIEKSMNMPTNQVVDEIVSLIKSGFEITRVQLKSVIGLSDGMFNFIRSKISVIDLAGDTDISGLKPKCSQERSVTEEQIRVVLAYQQLYHHLNSLKIPYFDARARELVNARMLVGGEPSDSNEIAQECSEKEELLSSDDFDPSYDDCLASLEDTMCLNEPMSSTSVPVQPPQAPTSASSACPKPAPTKSLPRVVMQPTSKIIYENDSDDDKDDGEPKKKPNCPTKKQRELPKWMWQSASSNVTNAPAESVAPTIKKRKIF